MRTRLRGARKGPMTPYQVPASNCVREFLLPRPAHFLAPRPRSKNCTATIQVYPRLGGGHQLLDLHLGTSVFELLLDRRGLVFVDAFLDGLGGAIHQVLGFLETEARDFADRLDDVDLV